MPRQTSVQLTEATERQAAELKALGFGSMTDIIRTAIDRMYQQETRTMNAMSSTLDDFFGNGDKVCAICGATDNLTPVGWDAFHGRPEQYFCQKCRDEIDATRAAERQADAAHDRRLDDIFEDTAQERE